MQRVRSFYDGDTDSDILMRLVESLKEEVNGVQDDQDMVLENLIKVTKFIEKLDEKAKEADDQTTHRSEKLLTKSLSPKVPDVILEEEEDEEFFFD